MAQATVNSSDLRQRIQKMLEGTPGIMTPMIARKLNVSEAEVLRHFPDDDTNELDGARAADLIEEFEQLGRVHVICSNGDCILESYGRFGGFSRAGGFLNVQTDTLDMHIKAANITQAFALRKPSHTDQQPTYSFQFFNEEGRSVFKVFVYKTVVEAGGDEINERLEAWNALKDKYALNA